MVLLKAHGHLASHSHLGAHDAGGHLSLRSRWVKGDGLSNRADW